MSCEAAALSSSHSLSNMAKDTLPTTEPSSSINPLKSRTKTAPLPPTPTKHKRFSFPTFHNKENDPESIDVPTRSKTTSKDHYPSATQNEKPSPTKNNVKDRRTSSASTAVPTTFGATLGIGAGVPKRPTMGQINRQNSVQTRYMTMLLHLDEIPRLHNILGSFFTVRLFSSFSVPLIFKGLTTISGFCWPVLSSSPVLLLGCRLESSMIR